MNFSPLLASILKLVSALECRQTYFYRRCISDLDPRGSCYNGPINVSRHEQECITWNNLNWRVEKPDNKDHNECRNPDPDGSDSPYCYVSDNNGNPVKESCDIPECRDLIDEINKVNKQIRQANFKKKGIKSLHDQKTVSGGCGNLEEDFEIDQKRMAGLSQKLAFADTYRNPWSLNITELRWSVNFPEFNFSNAVQQMKPDGVKKLAAEICDSSKTFSCQCCRKQNIILTVFYSIMDAIFGSPDFKIAPDFCKDGKLKQIYQNGTNPLRLPLRQWLDDYSKILYIAASTDIRRTINTFFKGGKFDEADWVIDHRYDSKKPNIKLSFLNARQAKEQNFGPSVLAKSEMPKSALNNTTPTVSIKLQLFPLFDSLDKAIACATTPEQCDGKVFHPYQRQDEGFPQFRWTLAHEILHALGLAHTQQNTIMYSKLNSKVHEEDRPWHTLDGFGIGITPLGTADGTYDRSLGYKMYPKLDESTLDELKRRYPNIKKQSKLRKAGGFSRDFIQYAFRGLAADVCTGYRGHVAQSIREYNKNGKNMVGSLNNKDMRQLAMRLIDHAEIE